MIRFNGRFASVLMMGFSSGLPIVLITSTLQAWYTVAGMSIVTIGALSMIGQPYVYKFLWAPVLDRFSPNRLGRRRGWILVLQLLLTVGFVVMAMLTPKQNPWWLATVALIVAFFSASQDTAIDAYRTDILHDDERGMGAALVTVGYRMAMLVSGAGALIMAAVMGWHSMYLVMAGIMFLEIFITIYSPKPINPDKPPLTLQAAVVEPWREFLSRKFWLSLLIFLVIYKVCDALALSLNTPFLLRGLHFTLKEVGAVSKVAGLGGALLGSLAGGLLMRRISLYQGLWWFGIAQMLSNGLFWLLAVVGHDLTLMGACVFGENFCGGLSSVAFVAFTMALCDKRYTATQYALFSALSAIGRVFIGPLAGVMAEHLGWANFYLWSIVSGIPALCLLMWLKRRVDILI